MSLVCAASRQLSAYAGSVGGDELAAVRAQAHGLAGLRVLHISASPFGGAVAETLAGLVPLQRDLGILADWYALDSHVGSRWSAMYRAFRGTPIRWTSDCTDAWYATMKRLAAEMPGRYDIVIVHDPQLLPLAEVMPQTRGRSWVWHCHLDTRATPPTLWEAVRRVTRPYAAALFPAVELVRWDLRLLRAGVARPAIDPCSARNTPLKGDDIDRVLATVQLDRDRPMLGFFAPFDQANAPVAAYGAYLLARQQIPELQLVLVDLSIQALDRPRCDRARLARLADGDADVHVLTVETDLCPREVNALQRAVTAVIQLDAPRGFRRGLAECQWKQRPAVVCGGGPLSGIINGRNGFAVEGAHDAATAIVRLVREPNVAADIGWQGRQFIARDHLITGVLDSHLHLFRALAGLRQLRSAADVTERVRSHEPAGAGFAG
ncbi:MAG: glycosyltransferase family protein [Dehalococcoidia bacterium]